MTTTTKPTAAPLALVTGASSGIGAAFAQRLAADDSPGSSTRAAGPTS